ncbi:hypothetical protein O3P69_014075 [Scylla paramamosain]|uniref:Uncharacterized protein n=1 Tax=Scylla paramamosain TaxID=85552 RepID=A0AAW0SRZ8_SCYPA
MGGIAVPVIEEEEWQGLTSSSSSSSSNAQHLFSSLKVRGVGVEMHDFVLSSDGREVVVGVVNTAMGGCNCAL